METLLKQPGTILLYIGCIIESMRMRKSDAACQEVVIKHGSPVD